MDFTLNQSIEILERTPNVLNTMVMDISSDWTQQNEGGDSWSVYDIIGHLIHGEKTDWIPRLEIILSDTDNKTFKAFDRFAQFKASKGKSLKLLLDEFQTLRMNNLQILKSKSIDINHLDARGIHPDFGEVTLSQLMATWVAHDLNHIAQIARVMAKQYKEEVGPWVQYLGIFKT